MLVAAAEAGDDEADSLVGAGAGVGSTVGAGANSRFFFGLVSPGARNSISAV